MMSKTKKIAIILPIFIIILTSNINTGLSFESNLTKKVFNYTEKTVLITGFESWKIYTPNPSQLIVENLSDIKIRGAKIISIIAPVIWGKALELITQAIIDYEPDIVINMGTGLINSIHVEKIGKNIKSCREPDNKGKIILFRKIDPFGPLFKLSNLPINNIVRKINKENIPAEKTYNAGSFICNEVMYGVLNFIENKNLCIDAGFIHVPLLSSQDPENGMDLGDMIDAIKIAISVCIKKS